MTPHKVGEYGCYIDPEVVVLQAPMGSAVIELALGGDGKWRRALTLRHSASGSVGQPGVNDVTFDTREQAIASAVESARRWFATQLAREDVWMANRVHAEAKSILAQIDAAYPPVGTQLSMFQGLD